jgi:signal transduction histidine kinase
MIVQSEAAQRLLDQDQQLADIAMATIEDTGRRALNEMRRILGVLRNSDGQAELAPQPGIGQISALVEANRKSGRQIALQVTGEPGPLPASVDLGLYRILAEALATTVAVAQTLAVTLRFHEHDIELQVTANGGTPLDWPTIGMCERAALCQGTVDVDVDTVAGVGGRLSVRLPRVFEEATA